ncbi:MAG: VOC family protein [Tomitella sp.]|nr:VOC family protein [Tomitella sp.]
MNQLTPYLCVADARAAIDWYTEALGAEVTYEPIIMDDGRVGHCELAIGQARWMLADQFDSAGVAAPDPNRGAAVSLHLTVTDVDAAADRVRATGSAMTRGPEDNPPVGRVAVFVDPFGHRWFLHQPTGT